MSETPLLNLPLLEAAQAQKHVTHNEALLLLDAAIQLSVISLSAAAPPASPSEGDRYLVAVAATGAWSGHEGELALFEAAAWRFLAPRAGWRLWDEAENKLLVFDGALWRDIQDIDVLNNMSLLGVNATADAANRLTVASPGVLFTHEGGDQRVKVNKQGAGNTASLLFQDNFSGRAEMGLAGDDDFHVKVSPDGGAWHEAIAVDASTGAVSFPNTILDLSANYPRTANLAGLVVTDGVTDNAAAIQAALDSLAATGGTVLLPPGRIKYDAMLQIPDYVAIAGAGMEHTVLVEGAGIGLGYGIFNLNYSTVDASLGAPGIVIRDLTIDGDLRQPPKWLSKADGTPITDPQADYLPGGCLAPTVQATLSLTVSGGAVTGASVVTGGAGYTHSPTAWVTGDGYAARLSLTTSGGAVTGVTIVEGGAGYTSATATVAGGGADPLTALYAADRRNADYALLPSAIGLAKASSPRIERVKFYRTGGNAVSDLGCDRLLIADCQFIEGGQADFVGSCVWTGAYGSDPGTEPFYRLSTDLCFERNLIRDWSRSVATVTSIRPAFRFNVIDGWGESCFFVNGTAVAPAITGNRAKRGRITDIVCSFVEGANDTVVAGNIVEDCDGRNIVMSTYGGGRVDGNTFVAPPARATTYPFGPFSERVGYGTGGIPLAGTQLSSLNRAAINLLDADSSPANAPRSFIAVNNRFSHDGGGAFSYLLDYARGAVNSIGDVLVSGNEMFDAPGMVVHNAANAAVCLDPTAQLIIENNMGQPGGNDPIGNGKLLAGEDMFNAAANGGFEKGDFGWVKGTGWIIESDAANARSGNWVARNADMAVTSSTLYSSDAATALAGDEVYAEAWLKASGTAGLNVRVQIAWYDAGKVFMSASNGNSITADQASYILSSVAAAAPSGAAYYRARVICTKTAGTVWADTITAFRRRNAASLLVPATVTTAVLGGDITAAGKALLDDASAAAQRTTLGLGTAAVENTAAFAAAVHSHSGLAPVAGSAGQVLRKNSLTDYDYSWASVSNASAQAALSADVQMAASNTWYDGPSVSLGAGTWLVQGHVTQVRSATSAEHVYARITDDTNNYASTQQYHGSVSGTGVSLAMTAVVTLAATTTVKLQGATSAGATASVMKAALTANGSGNNATQITAIKLV